MIPATQPYEARYAHERTDNTGKTDRFFSEKPVIAWDDDGRALVVDSDTGCLRRANSWDNFHSVQRGDSQVMAAVPADGWRVEYKDDDGSLHSNPLVTWLVQADGNVKPCDVDSAGFPGDPTDAVNFVRLYRSDEEAP